MNQSGIRLDALRQLSESLPHSRLQSMRDHAVAALLDKGLPTRRDEDWRYTDLSDAIDISNRFLAGRSSDDAPRQQRSPFIDTDDYDVRWVVIKNGSIDHSQLQDVDGIQVSYFSETGAPQTPDRALASLNAALLEDGLTVSINQPIAAVIGFIIHDHSGSDATSVQTRINIEVAADASAQCLLQQVSTGSADLFSNELIQISLAQRARVSLARLQQRGVTHLQTSNLRIRLDDDAEFRMTGVDLGGRLIRNDVDIEIAGRGAHAEFNGVFIVGDGQHIDNHTRVDHRIGPATSRQEYRGILSGRGKGVWNGKAIVHEGADGTDAEQANHNLLLSERAEINAKPELEIYTDDVKCSHGTTIGQLDEKALFYLRSRGIDAKAAEALLTRAFAASLLANVPVEAAQTAFSAAVDERLRQLVAGESA